MTFEELENASNEELRREITDRFNRYTETAPAGVERLWEAQFYMQELDRRDGSKIARRDMKLELIVIALIVAEIGFAIWGMVLANKEANEQAQLLVGQTHSLQALASNTEKTANLLAGLQSSTESVRIAVQDQLAIFYSVSVNFLWHSDSKRLQLINNGHTNVSYWGYQLQIVSAPAMMEPGERIITPAASYMVQFSQLYEALVKAIPKQKGTQSLPISIFLTNYKGDQFVLKALLIFEWQGDNLLVSTQTASIINQVWNQKLLKKTASPETR
jgi:flagellar basal body-associated protein FliL